MTDPCAGLLHCERERLRAEIKSLRETVAQQSALITAQGIRLMETEDEVTPTQPQAGRCSAIKQGEYNRLRCCYESGHKGDHNYVVDMATDKSGDSE